MCRCSDPAPKPDPKELFPVDRETYGPDYSAHLFEQYKLFVEGADKNSDRRQNANNYFIAINTALITLAGFTFNITTPGTKAVVWFILGIAGIVASGLFWFLVNAHKQLGTGKFTVIHEIEAKLPLAMFKYEWSVLGGGKDPKKYFPFSHIERAIPILTAVAYAILVVIALHYRAWHFLWHF